LISKQGVILEDSKEEDISFNKTISGQSPIRYGFYDNKISIDDGAHSLIKHFRGDSKESTGLMQFKNTSHSGINNNTRTSFNIQNANNTSPFLKYTGNAAQSKSSTLGGN
jgi:hypothetical protein